MKNRIIRGSLSFIIALTFLTPFLSTICYGDSENVVLQADFENGSLEGMATMGNTSLVIDQHIAYSGSSCLKVTKRSANWNGASISNSSILQKGKKYKITAYVYHKQASQEDMKCTLKNTDSMGADTYDNIIATTVPPSTWTEFSSEFSVPHDSSAATLYFEATHATMDFYIDFVTLELIGDVEVSQAPENVTTGDEPKTQLEYTPPASMPHRIFFSDFETGTTESWGSVDIATLTLDYDHHSSGEASLKVSNRNANWDGPKQFLDDYLKASKTYHCAVYVYHESATSETMSATVNWKNSNGTTTYNSVASAQINPGKWTLLEGEVTTADDFNFPSLYIEASNADLVFYIDNVSIFSDEPLQNSNTVSNERIPQNDEYTYGFESDLEDWNSRSDIRIVRTDEYAHSGKYSVYITDRDVYWSGLTRIVDFVDREISNTYSAYVMYNGDEYESSHVFHLNVQYDFEGVTNYQEVGIETVEKGKWKKISGEFTIPKGAKNVSMYVQTEKVDEGTETLDDLMSFYVDDISIIRTSVAKKKKTTMICIIVAASLFVITVITILLRKIIINAIKTNRALMSAALDAMTQTLNRNTYEQKLDILHEDPSICRGMHIAVCDVNFLKFVNDNYGHEMGDEAITRCGTLLLRAVGKKGLVYRTGGDEFVCMSPVSFEEQIRHEIELEASKYNGYPFSVAVGFSHHEPGDVPDIDEMIEKADKAMYENKQLIKSQNAEFVVR